MAWWYDHGNWKIYQPKHMTWPAPRPGAEAVPVRLPSRQQVRSRASRMGSMLIPRSSKLDAERAANWRPRRSLEQCHCHRNHGHSCAATLFEVGAQSSTFNGRHADGVSFGCCSRSFVTQAAIQFRQMFKGGILFVHKISEQTFSWRPELFIARCKTLYDAPWAGVGGRRTQYQTTATTDEQCGDYLLSVVTPRSPPKEEVTRRAIS